MINRTHNRRGRATVVRKHPAGLGELTASQYYGASHERPTQPERVLLSAVLEEAMLTLAKHMGKRDGHSRKLAQEALQWFETRGDGERYFTFDYVCLALGLNSDLVRQETLRALREGLAVTMIPPDQS